MKVTLFLFGFPSFDISMDWGYDKTSLNHIVVKESTENE